MTHFDHQPAFAELDAHNWWGMFTGSCKLLQWRAGWFMGPELGNYGPVG
jgi:hypothetical protein